MSEELKKDPMNTMEEEIAEAKKQAVNTVSHFTLNLSKPFVWEGTEYKELEFDFSLLTGKDFLNIEAEVQSKGYGVITPEFSTPFLTIMAIRACKQPITSDALDSMPIVLFNRIRSRGRSFLMNSEM